MDSKQTSQRNFHYKSKIRVFYQEPRFGPGVAELLRQTEATGSIHAACGQMNMAYSKAWKILKGAEQDLGFPLLHRTTGGRGGGCSRLTEEGRKLVEHYEAFFSSTDAQIGQAFLKHFHSYMPEDSFLKNRLMLPEQVRLISLVGGGGKTSTMYRLAKEYAAWGKKVLLTTSTHILVPPPEEVPILLYHPVSREQLDDAFCRSSIVAVASRSKDKPGKLSGVPAPFFRKALDSADLILCEADGARMLPIKAPASHEPAIPPGSDIVIVLAGLSGLGRPLKEVCHRKDLAARLLGCTPSAPLGTAEFARLIGDSRGLMKGLAGQEEKVRIFLNQADDGQRQKAGEEIRRLLQAQGIPHVLVGSLHNDF